MNIKTGTMIAIAAGGLFASACKKEEAKRDEPTKMEAPKPDEGSSAAVPKPDEAKPEAEQVAKVDCAGVNACKGQGTCKTPTSGCGGQNECKGKGVVAMTEAECKEKGGTIANK